MGNSRNYCNDYRFTLFVVAKKCSFLVYLVTQEGEFPFYCSVPCGEGEVDGKKRTHFDMIGKVKVKSIVSETR